jgi:hypothetical protein
MDTLSKTIETNPAVFQKQFREKLVVKLTQKREAIKAAGLSEGVGGGVLIYTDPTYQIYSQGNGAFYTIYKNGSSVFLQGDDATEFGKLLDSQVLVSTLIDPYF